MANEVDVQLHPMTGWEKRDIVENTLKTGDAATANNYLHSIQDQKLFMTLLASKAEGDSVPGLVITADKDGQVHQIKSDKMTISDAGGQLNAHADHQTWGQYFQAKWDSVTNFGSGAADAVKDYARHTDLGDALSRSGKSDSLLNQNIDAKVDRALGQPASDH
jgi:hypothetical protein